MNTGLRISLLVMAAALLAGAIWGGTQNMVAWTLTLLSLAFLCVVFAMIAWAWGR